MFKKKIIKDSVHNYIEIEEPYFKIIDTSGFQRLKSIKQTSYASLYPSSTHDRFTHSLGTYCLGKKVIDSVFSNMTIDHSINGIAGLENSIKYTFNIACLLHDFGHAPFSHTGENFYKFKKIPEAEEFKFYNKYIKVNKIRDFSYIDFLLIEELCKALNCTVSDDNKVLSAFLDDYVNTLREDSAKPHEKMSALLALRQLSTQINEIAESVRNDENDGTDFIPDLFIRCIIGTVYKNTPGKNSFLNAIINLLNSDCIDVDKLDYLMRDTYMTGHKSTSIDIDRLISSFTIVNDSGNKCRLAFKKKGLSIIESVILASDSSKRWVQNHPVIMYDSYLTQRCISEMICLLESEDSNFFDKLFSVDALTEKGIDIAGEHYFLLSDYDLLGLFKKAYNKAILESNKIAIGVFKEYFSRDERKHPLWKSEMEFNVCFNDPRMTTAESETSNSIKAAIQSINDITIKETGVNQLIFNNETLLKYKDIIPNNAKTFLNAMNLFYQRNGKVFDIAILSTSGFETKLGKLKRRDFFVEMPEYGLSSWNQDGCLYPYKNLVTINESKGQNLFYFYSREKIDIKSLLEFLFMENWQS